MPEGPPPPAASPPTRDAEGRFLEGHGFRDFPRPYGSDFRPRWMFRMALDDPKTRENIVKNLQRLARTPRGALLLLEAICDRLEGKPVQFHEVAARRKTVFELTGDRPPTGEPSAGAPEETVA